MTWIDYIMT